MKKALNISLLVASIGLIGGALAGVHANVSTLKQAKAEDLSTYIEMNESFFTNWTNDAGGFKERNATFWGEGYSFEALDKFYSGESAEGWTGTLTSRTWKQSTQYIYFQLGAAMDYRVDGDNAHDDLPDAGNPVYLKFHYGTYTSDNYYNNTFVENPMTLRYFKIPDEAFAALKSSGNDFDMSVEIVDGKTRNYGFANFGYLHVNQTLESTSDAMRYFLNNLSTDSRDWEINKRKAIMNTYFDNADQKAVFFAPVSNVNDSFSSNGDFLKHWYFDHNYFNNEYGTPRHFDTAIGTDTFRPDADNSNNMPFNNDGGFFRGWYESAEGHVGGFVAADNLRYRFISRPFVLSGTGIVSIKMAGKASLHVIDATVKNTDAQAADLAWVDNHAFQDTGDWNNIAASGMNTTAMVNHVINLEAYLGKTIQLAIADYDTSGWSAAYFDELVSCYEDAPAYHIDVCTQQNNSGTFYPAYADIYVNSTNIHDENNKLGVKYNGGNEVNTANDNAILNHQDTTDSKAAHIVWESYIDTVRGGNQGTNYCSDILVSDEVKAVLSNYNALSQGAKEIVCASDDFERVGGGYSTNPTIYGSSHQYSLSNSLLYLAGQNNMSAVVYSNGFAMNQSADTVSMVIIASIILTATTFLLFFALKKRKENN